MPFRACIECAIFDGVKSRRKMETIVQRKKTITIGEISPEDLLPGQESLLAKLSTCDARLDILHFEQLTSAMTEDDDEEFLDPGALLGVAESLAQLVDGVAVDPGSGTFV